MNRMLYQLSYAAIFRSHREHGYYTDREALCQQLFRGTALFFAIGANKNLENAAYYSRVMKLQIIRECVVMACGGSAYVLVELLWRGRSHISMFLLGGLCFWLIGRLDRRFPVPLAAQACLGACVVTALELVTGLIVNRWLGLGVWDYSGLPMNFLGQICLYYFVLWIPLSAAAVLLDDGLRRVLFGTPMPHYRLV